MSTKRGRALAVSHSCRHLDVAAAADRARIQVGCAGGVAVAVGTTGVAFGGTLVAVGGTVVAVGGSAVAVGDAADCCGPRSGFPLTELAAAFMSVPKRSPV